MSCKSPSANSTRVTSAEIQSYRNRRLDRFRREILRRLCRSNGRADGLLSAAAAGTEVHRATALYKHSKDLISIPRWMLAGEKPLRAFLLHEMAHGAANEPEPDRGPKWHKEMHRLWKAQAPINLHDVTPGSTSHELVTKYGVGSEFWAKL